ncbi:hypothetical protein [Kibdelosporangium phytohabitans]|uniref:Uncharacterized protein n=1 Tax=Kibdelosporangium phytohabitans TaxID=860235 RepID=A0A0N9IDN0_9PSEU|nr:hypothetical protein [Kibdelosporangium phytohabitans]ALG12877.1 hypothetical protein AOZ06_43880 [Kibdelosporangium phytohabitans]MBE1464579.1 hypothetical protein [Kibdelosporangium phytohabitans]
MTHVLAAVLRDAMVVRLAGLDSLARRVDVPVVELRSLTAAMREILELHQPDGHGRCRGCSAGLRRGRKFPCRVWLIARRHLLAPTDKELHR